MSQNGTTNQPQQPTTPNSTPPGGEQQPPGAPNPNAQQQQQVENFETWIAGQPEPVRNAYTSHTSGLLNALREERSARGDLEKKIRELGKSAQGNTELQTQLTQLADQLNGQRLQNEFYDAASQRGVRNLRLAWLSARDLNAIDERGRINWALLEETFPELFSKGPAAPAGNAGTGNTGNQPNQPQASMNRWIRVHSGRDT